MEKYNLLPQKLISENVVTKSSFIRPKKASEKSILAVHDELWWHRLKNLDLTKSEERRSGFPLSRGLIEREITIAQGTIDVSISALNTGAGMNIAGGTHHAGPDFGEGFCLLNDIAIASQFLLDHKLVKQVLVVDLDVHQGNGTALIFQDNPQVFTFSMHGEKNFPFKKAKSDLDIGLEDGIGDSEYIYILKNELESLIQYTKADFIFYQAGVDVLEQDSLGRLSLSLEGCRLRDKIVYELAKTYKIPVCTVMGGGYAKELETIVSAHLNTFMEALSILS